MVTIWLLLTGSWCVLYGLSTRVDLRQPTPEVAGLMVALMLLGLGLVPLLLVAWIFVRSFDDQGLSPEDLARLPRGGRE